jgi:hypothetical protein
VPTYGEVNPAVRMPGGVVDQVAHHLAERQLVAEHPSVGDLRGVDHEAVARPGRLGSDQVVEIDLAPPLSQGALVGPGQQEHLVDQALHPDRLLEHDLGELSVGHGLRVGPGYLGGLAEAGERRPQLVGGVGHEALLSVPRRLEPRQHRVHRGGQQADLVLGPRHRHPAVKSLVSDHLDLSSDAFHRRERTSDDRPGRRADHQQEQGDADQE